MPDTAQYSPGTVVWTDLTVRDADTVRDFYSAVVGWKHSPVDMKGYSDYNMESPADGTPVVGVCHARGSNANLPARWLIYIVVADLDASIKHCTELGGKVIDGPRGAGNNRFCCIQDPAGAYCCLVQ